MIRWDYFFWAIFFLSAASTNASAPALNNYCENAIMHEINSFIQDEFHSESESNVVFHNFLVNQSGDLYTVDFMLTQEGETVILDSAFELEFYKVNGHSTEILKYYECDSVEISS